MTPVAVRTARPQIVAERDERALPPLRHPERRPHVRDLVVVVDAAQHARERKAGDVLLVARAQVVMPVMRTEADLRPARHDLLAHGDHHHDLILRPRLHLHHVRAVGLRGVDPVDARRHTRPSVADVHRLHADGRASALELAVHEGLAVPHQRLVDARVPRPVLDGHVARDALGERPPDAVVRRGLALPLGVRPAEHARAEREIARRRPVPRHAHRREVRRLGPAAADGLVGPERDQVVRTHEAHRDTHAKS